jgi:hypothetical protein
MKEIKCQKCGEPMKNLGNISGIVYTSYPVQWDDTYVCDKCKTKQNVREQGKLPPDYSHLAGYESQNNF